MIAAALVISDHFLSVHLLAAETQPELEEGVVRHGAGQRGVGAHRPPTEAARQEEEAGRPDQGGPGASGHARSAAQDGEAVVAKER